MSFTVRSRATGWLIFLLLCIASFLMVVLLRTDNAPDDQQAVESTGDVREPIKTRTSTPVDPQPTYEPAGREDLLALVNHERTEAGGTPLRMHDQLNASAQAKVEDMVAQEYHAHANPATGMRGYEYIPIHAPGVCSQYMSENITSGAGRSSTAESTHMRWMNSTSHREAMLNPLYTLVGYGIMTDAKGYVKVVQHLCQGL